MNSLETNKKALHMLKAGHEDCLLVECSWIHWTNGLRAGCKECKSGWVHRHTICTVCEERWNFRHAKINEVDVSPARLYRWEALDRQYDRENEDDANQAK